MSPTAAMVTAAVGGAPSLPAAELLVLGGALGAADRSLGAALLLRGALVPADASGGFVEPELQAAAVVTATPVTSSHQRLGREVPFRAARCRRHR